MSPILEKAYAAKTESEAVKILIAGGYSKGAAREAAAIAFGKLGGDIVGDHADGMTADKICEGVPAIPKWIPKERLRFVGLRAVPGGNPRMEPTVELYFRDTGLTIESEDPEQRGEE